MTRSAKKAPARKHVLATDIAAYEAMRDTLEQHHLGKFVVFHSGEFHNAFDSFDNAVRAAVKEFGTGPYLIREVGRNPSMPMPASVAYRPIHASG